MRRISVVVLMVALMATWLPSVVKVSGAQESATPAADATPVADAVPTLFTADGIDAPILASALIDLPVISEPRLLLERIELPAGSSLPSHTTTANELLYVEEGILSVEDDFGFGTTASTGTHLAFNPNAQYTAANGGANTVTLLRFSLAAGEVAVAAAVDEDLDVAPAATPVDATPIAVAVTAEPQRDVLLDQPFDDLSGEQVTMFVARVTLEPGSSSGEQSHAGPVGIIIEEGTVTVLSPSGMAGQLEAGRAVVLPEDASLVASNEGDAEATALIVGVVESDNGLMAEVTPEPTSTVAPTQTPVPAPTPEPTPTSEPTATSEPTPMPETTSVPTTESGTILQLGETWRVERATMTVTLDDSGRGWVTLKFVYTNISDSRVDFLPSTGAVRVYDDQRINWSPSDSHLDRFLGNRIILEPDESFESSVYIEHGAGSNYSANVFLVVEGFGEIGAAKWGFTFNNGRVLTIPPDAVDPTIDSSAGDASSHIEDVAQFGQVDAAAALPGEVDLPPGLMLIEDGSLQAEDITASFSDPATARTFFEDWAWQENSYAHFAPSSGGTTDSGLVYVDIGIHRFADADGATQALDYFCNVRQEQMLLSDIAISPIADQSRSIIGSTNMGVEASVYARVAGVVIRVSVMSAGVDPLEDAAAITQGIAANLA